MNFLEQIAGLEAPAGWIVVKATADRAAGDPGSPPVSVDGLLAPDEAAVAQALASLPNQPGNDRDYDQWVGVMISIAGCTGKSEAGRQMWLDWSAQYDANTGTAEAKWNSLDASAITIGWAWLSDRAASEDANFRLASAQADFSGTYVNGVAALDGGLFAVPATDLGDIMLRIEGMDIKSDEALRQITKQMARSSISVTGRERALRRLKDRTGISLKALGQQLANDVRNLTREQADVQTRLARMALAFFGADKIAYFNMSWFRYNGKFWERQPNDLFIYKILLEATEKDATLLQADTGQRHHSHSMIRAALNNLQALTDDTLAPLNNPSFAVRRAINVLNGSLWFDEHGAVKLKPHSPGDCFLNCLEIAYDPLAACALYDQCLADTQSRTAYVLRKREDADDWEVVNDAIDAIGATAQDPVTLPDGRLAWKVGTSIKVADIADNVRLVNEILGYSLIADRFARAFAVFKGNGSNGKSEVIRLLTSRMRDMAMATSIDTMTSRFFLSQIQGRTLITVDEGSDQPVSSSRIKELTETGVLHGDVKNSSFVQIAMTSMVIINTNEHLYTSDASDGIRVRMILVPFGKRYAEGNWINSPWKLIARDDQEMSGALNRWIDGVSDVIRRRHIQRSRASTEAQAAWEIRNTPEAAFVQDWCIRIKPQDAKGEGEKLGDLHRAFTSWNAITNGSGKRVHGLHRFSEILQQMGYSTYLSQGMTKVQGLWVNPKRADMPGFIEDDFSPIDHEI